MTDAHASNRFTFFGKVHPERCNVSIPELHLQLFLPTGKLLGDLRYSISLSQVTATFTTKTSVENVFTLKNAVEDAVRIALDALGYTLACGYDLEVIQMVGSGENPPTVFGVGIPAVDGLAAKAGVDFSAIMNLFGDARGQYLQRCLSDLREAIRAPKDTGFFCYRGIEALRQYFLREKGAKDENASWEMLRTHLSIERGEIDQVKGFADPIRHGAGLLITDEDRAKVFAITWNIVNSFVVYAREGYK